MALARRWGGVSSGRGGGDVEIDGFLVSARTGDELGFAGLYRLLAGKVAGYVRGHGVVDVDDVVNEVFLAAFVGLGSFAGDAQAFRSWLFGIAWNKTADWHRRERRRPAEVDDAESAVAVQVGGDAEEDAWRDLGASRVEALLASLTDDQRDVLLLRVVADLSLEETARIMGRPVGPVKALQHRALAALRRNISSGAVSK